VLEVGAATVDFSKEPDQFIVTLDKTIFHPQGGGQPNDDGTLTQTVDDATVKFQVTGLVTKEDVIYHVGTFEPKDARFEVGSEVTCNVDEDKRRTYARVHSAGHLLDIAMEKAGRSDLQPSKGYHFATGAYVEYIGAVDAKDREALISVLNEECKKIIVGTPEEEKVFKKMCSYTEANELLAKAGGVPPYIKEGQELRVLKLTEEDFGCPCGGTHVEHVNDIGELTVTKITKKSKNIRVAYNVKAVAA